MASLARLRGPASVCHAFDATWSRRSWAKPLPSRHSGGRTSSSIQTSPRKRNAALALRAALLYRYGRLLVVDGSGRPIVGPRGIEQSGSTNAAFCLAGPLLADKGRKSETNRRGPLAMKSESSILPIGAPLLIGATLANSRASPRFAGPSYRRSGPLTTRRFFRWIDQMGTARDSCLEISKADVRVAEPAALRPG